MPQLTIYINGKKKNIGELMDNGSYVKKVKKSKHLFRKLDAWGFDYRTLVDSILPQCSYVFVHDTEDGVYYMAEPKDFGSYVEDEETGKGKFVPSGLIEIRHYNRGEDSGTQIFLARRHWRKFNKSQFEDWRIR